MKSPNCCVGRHPIKKCYGKMGQRNSHQPQQTYQLTCMCCWILDSKQGSTTRRSSCVQLLMLEYSWSLDTYSHLSWTPVSTFKLDIKSPKHFTLRDVKLASGCSHTAAVPHCGSSACEQDLDGQIHPLAKTTALRVLVGVEDAPPCQK